MFLNMADLLLYPCILHKGLDPPFVLVPPGPVIEEFHSFLRGKNTAARQGLPYGNPKRGVVGIKPKYDILSLRVISEKAAPGIGINPNEIPILKGGCVCTWLRGFPILIQITHNIVSLMDFGYNNSQSE